MTNIHIDYQTIVKNGRPEYVIIPYQQFIKTFPKYVREKTIPHAVVSLMVDKNISRLRAWREYLGFTQQEISEKVGISKAELNKFERKNAMLSKTIIQKFARALELKAEHLA